MTTHDPADNESGLDAAYEQAAATNKDDHEYAEYVDALAQRAPWKGPPAHLHRLAVWPYEVVVAIAAQEDDEWLLTVHDIGTTRVRSLDEAEDAVRDMITAETELATKKP